MKQKINKRSKVKKVKLTAKKNRFWIWMALIFMTIYICWRIIFTIPDMNEYGLLAFICGVLLVASETISAVEALDHYVNMNNMIIPRKPEIPEDMYPDVDVFIATHNEEEELLYKTINGCRHMKYPDPSKVHIYVCDDMNRPHIAQLARRMNVGYMTLTENKDAKAGNLNNALWQTHSPLIATFDADMIPFSDFLMETVPYMFLPVMKQEDDGTWAKCSEEEIDPKFKMGFIQTPQSFYNPDLFQFYFYSEDRIPNEQDYFFKEINVGRNRANAPIYAGSNTLISREALEAVGGIATKTITEDFETGIRIQSKGYTCYAIPKVLAHGLAPTDFKNLIKQRERWGRGCIASIRHVNLFFNKGLPIRGKLSYLSAFLYWFTFLRRLIYIISPILFVLFNVPVVICGWKGLLFIWLPSYLLYNHALKVSSGNIRTHRWSNIIDTVIFPYLILPILAEFLLIKQTKFHVTNKNRANDNDSDIMLGLPHMVLLAADVIALIMAFMSLILYKNIGGIIIIYWLIVNALNLAMALFFVAGRKNLRNNDRFKAELPVKIKYKDNEYIGQTVDISDNGLAVCFDMPVFIKENETVELAVEAGCYAAKMECRVAHVQEKDGKWKYGLSISNIEDEQKGEYFQIVFNRHHSMKDEMVFSVGTFDDIFINIHRRLNGNQESVRKYPRVVVGEAFKTSEGSSVMLEDINYRYVKLSGTSLDHVRILLGNGLYLQCKSSPVRSGLYEIENYEELIKEQDYLDKIACWNQKALKKGAKI